MEELLTWSMALHFRNAAGILMIGAFAASYPASAQRLPPLPDRDRLEGIIEAIQDEQAANGAYSEELLEPLTTLALLYLEGGDHDLASSTIERVLQVIRANYGLTSIEQLPWIHQWVRSAEAKGDAEAAWRLEQAMLDLIDAHPTELSVVPILHEVGDKRMDLLNAYETGKFPPQIALGCYYSRYRNPRTGCRAGSRRVVVDGIVSDAWRLYRDAIDVLRRNRLYASDELAELEMKVLRSSYRYGNFLLGRRSLLRLATYLDDGGEPIAVARALVDVVDWDMIYTNRGLNIRNELVNRYQRLYRQMEQNGADRSLLDAMFAPEVPIVVPAFLPNPLSTVADDSVGYIDAAFTVTPHGAGRDFEILETSGDVARADRRRLARLVAQSTFRPRSADGVFEEPSRVEIRYYVSRSEPE